MLSGGRTIPDTCKFENVHKYHFKALARLKAATYRHHPDSWISESPHSGKVPPAGLKMVLAGEEYLGPPPDKGAWVRRRFPASNNGMAKMDRFRPGASAGPENLYTPKSTQISSWALSGETLIKFVKKNSRLLLLRTVFNYYRRCRPLVDLVGANQVALPPPPVCQWPKVAHVVPPEPDSFWWNTGFIPCVSFRIPARVTGLGLEIWAGARNMGWLAPLGGGRGWTPGQGRDQTIASKNDPAKHNSGKKKEHLTTPQKYTILAKFAKYLTSQYLRNLKKNLN